MQGDTSEPIAKNIIDCSQNEPLVSAFKEKCGVFRAVISLQTDDDCGSVEKDIKLIIHYTRIGRAIGKYIIFHETPNGAFRIKQEEMTKSFELFYLNHKVFNLVKRIIDKNYLNTLYRNQFKEEYEAWWTKGT